MSIFSDTTRSILSIEDKVISCFLEYFIGCRLQSKMDIRVFNKVLYTHVFVCQETPHVPAGIHLKPAFPRKSMCVHIHTHGYLGAPLSPQRSHTHHTTGTTHTLVLIWNIVGGAGPVEGSVNSSGATPPFERPKFPFLRSAAWAGSAVQQAFSRHGRPQRPR